MGSADEIIMNAKPAIVGHIILDKCLRIVLR